MSRFEMTLIGNCPTLRDGMDPEHYLESIRIAGARAERFGWSAMLVYSDHMQLEPWLVAKMLLASTNEISPLVAVQPLYMHPYSVSKMVATLSLLYDRPIHLNFISGGFPLDLETLCDSSSHDERYERLTEYAEIVQKLLSEESPLTFRGKHYQIQGLQLKVGGRVPERRASMFTVSGSSPAGLKTARKLGARAIQYLRPWCEYDSGALPADLQHGARLGIIVRETSDAAWRIARSRYPENEVAMEIREYLTLMSDSVWVKELGRDIRTAAGHPYWLGPYKNNYVACPFLVGDVRGVADELAGYLLMGVRTFLLENPRSDEDAEYITAAFELAEQVAAANHATSSTSLQS